ncbi:MAG: TSUP family transporter [Elusimicrobia bacterium]|nr:TSUP family transporter [Elusimicrobiota bacterium]
MPTNFTIETVLILSLFVFLAGIIDSISGGGGLITLPAYIHSGLKLELLLGTNKLSSTLGTLVAAIKYLKELRFKKSYLFALMIIAVIGSYLGAKFISSIPASAIKYILIVLLPPIAFILSTRRNFGLSDFSSKWSNKNILLKSILIAFFISFYDGLFGPGTGAFFAIAFTSLCGYDLLKATALSKLLNFTSNISALVTFLILGRVNIKLGILMTVAGIAGNYLGASLALKKGIWVIKPMLFIVSNALLIKVIYDMIR